MIINTTVESIGDWWQHAETYAPEAQSRLARADIATLINEIHRLQSIILQQETVVKLIDEPTQGIIPQQGNTINQVKGRTTMCDNNQNNPQSLVLGWWLWLDVGPVGQQGFSRFATAIDTISMVHNNSQKILKGVAHTPEEVFEWMEIGKLPNDEKDVALFELVDALRLCHSICENSIAGDNWNNAAACLGEINSVITRVLSHIKEDAKDTL